MKKQIQRIKFINRCKKIAVFSTSEIQKYNPDDNYESMISTGLLEIALSQGYKVYVVTSRTKFSDDVDTWWQSQVERVYTGYKGEGATDKGYISAWKSFYTDIGINLELLSFPDDKDPSWMDYQHNLSRFGIKQGWNFRPNGWLL